MPFKPPVELSRPTILNIIAIVCYCLAMLFHLIAFATDSWSSLTLDGVRYQVGLWKGCRHNETADEWICSTEVFEEEVFKTGSDWHIGTRIMMVFALLLLFVLQFFIIAYACIRRLERYKSKLVAIILGLSATSAFCHFLILIMYGSEVGKIADSYVQGSFGIIVISFLLELAIIVLTQIDKRRRFPSDNVFIETGPKTKQGDQTDHKSHNNRAFTIDDHRLGSVDRKGSTRTSVSSLSETETYRKFASFDAAAGLNGPTLNQKSPIRTSVSSLTEAETYRKFGYMRDPGSSTGSTRSVQTQGTMFTNLSSSIEMRV